MQCGLLGGKLGHSYSPQIHSKLGDYSYRLFEKPPEALEDFLKHGDFSGLNVTIPYKKAVLPYCSALSDRARQLGAVNTIVRQPDGSLLGHNTDYFGFTSMVEHSGLSVAGKKVLVLGSGGASATAVAVLQALGATVVVISRTGENHYQNLCLHEDAAVIVNATPVGMFPNAACSPLSISQFPKLEGVLDLIYNPARTQLLMDAEARGLIAENGLWMLVAQAKESAEWFTGKQIENRYIREIYDTLRLQMENIILVGMPGSGKSTVGALLAQRLGRHFVDADSAVTEKAGKSIPDIFAEAGEDSFRRLETEVLSELGKESGLVIATGGGCVTREENYSSLHRNGRIIWLQRNLALLPTSGRPLSQTGNLEQMYALREPLYTRFADITVCNDGTPAAAVDTLLEQLGGSL